MYKYFTLILISAILVACSPSASAIQTPVAKTVAAIPTQTAYPTYTAMPPIIITATLPPYTSTPAPTLTPSPTNTPQPTENPELTTDKVEGVWLVGDEVAAGKWRAIGGDCYMVTKDSQGGQMNMESGNGSVIVVPEIAFTVEFVSYPGNCTWKYLGK